MPEPTKPKKVDQTSLTDQPANPTEPTESQEVSTQDSQEPDSLVPDSNTSLTPVQKVQADVIRFAGKLLDKERAAEFATRVALIARENAVIAKAIQNNPDSFLVAYMASVTLDLMPNTPEGLAYIIPYGDKVQFQTGYKGLIKLARRSGEIKSISAELVFNGDEFDVEFGTRRGIHHRPKLDIDRTDYKLVTNAYATASLTNGEDVFVVMTRKELDKIKSTAKAGNTDSPWQKWPERQAIKTVLKRLTQVLPSGADDALQKAVAMDSLAEVGKLNIDKDTGSILEGEVVGLASDIQDRIKAAKTAEELQNILNNLSPRDKALAQPLIEERFGEL